MPSRLLIADDEKHVAEGLRLLLEADGFDAVTAGDGIEAWDLVKTGEFDLLLADLRMPGIDGLELFARMRENGIETEVIFITGESSVDSAVDAMRSGAYDYLSKPLDMARLRALIPRALEKYEVRTAYRELQKKLESLTRYGDMLGQSEEMRRVYDVIEAVAPSSASVLIIGESGTGKELVARAIHAKSPRRRGPFVGLNCGAFPREILENELFGHEKGAFTGAITEKPGSFEQADKGTLLLDEVAEMQPDIQVKFLRALEQRSFRRLGGKKEISVDIRVIAATNKNVEDSLREGRLREDMYHRLAVVPIVLPPLRDRDGDIRLLADEFLKRFASELKKKITGFSDGALEYIQTYRWPGNVRELKNAVERAVILAHGDTIQVAALKPRYLALDEAEVRIPVGTGITDTVRQLTLKTFAFTGGDHTRTARILGIEEASLREQLLSYLQDPVEAS
jgi:DNA-binding NtrC family response regulator